MPESTRTPNPATTTRPERSSKKVAHKKPLAWLPLALLALLALLAVLIFLIVRGANSNDNNMRRPRGQSRRQQQRRLPAPAPAPVARVASSPALVRYPAR